ncbi:MAG: sulfite exporter TauE/SafE family protein [Elusimicrobia bacterium]|nr:sulfite exporter TauE/SafE family protein [Elusimicrobiota bacterium]
MTALLLEGLGLGLSTGAYCAAACVPVLAPYLLAEEKGFTRDLLVVGKFLLGRLAAYLLFAIAAGLAGSALGPLPAWLSGASLLACGALLLGYSLVRGLPGLDLCARLSGNPAFKGAPFLLGFLVGVNPCPPFVAGLARLLTVGSVAGCAAYFTAFFVGTTVYVLPVLLAVPLKAAERLRSAAGMAAGLCGLWFCGLGLSRLLRG